MPYTAEISRANPSCFLFLIDQSGSMEDPIPSSAGAASEGPSASGPTRTKAEGVADAINRLLQNLVIKCAKSEGVRDYYHVGVLGYGGAVKPAFGGALAGKELVPISEIANSPARVEERSKKVDDGAGGLVEQKVKFPIWFDAIANGGTPMCEALNRAQAILTDWLTQHSGCFPPIVINITDGESTDGDPSSAADKIKSLTSDDGGVLLFNLHLSSQRAAPIEFPDSEAGLPDKYAQLLFRMSSPLPEYMRGIAQQEGFAVSENTRGFVFNADMVSVIRFLDIGTRPSNLR
ncbi:MAG TPA: vWA domain-containing protein [Chthonomonadaceae bacterium]|nr:vWA domain-containing protein [Chthonomonadaceae bacterium]